MTVQLNHTIVWCRDRNVSASFLSDMLGLPAPTSWGPFFIVGVDNGVSQGRIHERGLEYWADPGLNAPGEVNHNDGGRGVYWHDPDGHPLEVITRPYGSGE